MVQEAIKIISFAILGIGIGYGYPIAYALIERSLRWMILR
jgi:hypothetical protein